ncbi:class I SAM-dependent methyltransferase [Paenibacillus turpanensis]|uniref:class I SAM-dependent methyltransferase n=1 Tax=Paenibacillus turpanensis TaxID=2689078 RepID=UPI0014079489|nr:class I SAM-dependent methyltransferase [Paenibacillus turpanensis]
MKEQRSVTVIMKEIENQLLIESDDVMFLETSNINTIGTSEVSNLNQVWNVPGDIPIIPSSNNSKGKIVFYIKKVVNKLINWRLTFITDNQRNFNATAVRVINHLNEELNESRKHIERVEDELSFLKKEIELERATLFNQINSIKKEKEKSLPIINYLEFENKFRGSNKFIKDHMSNYLVYLDQGMKVLDLGCGRGEFMELLKENEIEALGVDSNSHMVEFCHSNSLNVIQDDIINFLAKTKQTFDCIFISQVVEHLKVRDLIKLIELAHNRLNVNGLLIIETPNPETILVSSYTFNLDYSHEKPLPPSLLGYLIESQNFDLLETLRFHPFPTEEMLPESVSDNHLINKNFQKLNQLLYGPRDYAVIARKKEI